MCLEGLRIVFILRVSLLKAFERFVNVLQLTNFLHVFCIYRPKNRTVEIFKIKTYNGLNKILENIATNDT